MQLQGTVISYTASTKIQKQGGGTYDAWELVYRSPENEVKQLAKPIQSLKFNKPLASALASLVPNDEFTADLEKNAAGFWDVKEVVKGAAEPKAASVPPASTAVTSERAVQPQRAVNRVTGSTYETPEERAKKQVVIIRQSQISNAIAYLTDHAGPAGEVISVERVVEVAEAFEKFVNKGLKATAKKYLDVKLSDEESEAK